MGKDKKKELIKKAIELRRDLNKFELARDIYKNLRENFLERYKPVIGYKNFETLAPEHIKNLSEAIQFGHTALVKLNYIRKINNKRGFMPSNRYEYMQDETTFIRGLYDELWDIMTDPNKKIVPDSENGLEVKV